MRILTVAKGRALLQAQEQRGRKLILLRAPGVLHPGGDGSIVGGCVLEGFGGQFLSDGQGYASLPRLHLGDHPGIVTRIDQDSHRIGVLGGSPHQGWAADINFLDGFLTTHLGTGNGFGKRVKIHYHKLNGIDVVFCEGLAMSRVSVPRQDSSVDSRVKSLDPSIQNLREAGPLRNSSHTHPLLFQGAGRPTRRDDLNSQFRQGAGERPEAGFVRDADQGCSYLHFLAAGYWLLI